PSSGRPRRPPHAPPTALRRNVPRADVRAPCRAAAESAVRRARGRALSCYAHHSMYDSYDDFLKAAVKQFYDRGWKSRKGTFAALVIASGQAVSLAADSVKSGEGLKKVAYGAVGVVALRIALRMLVGGPLRVLPPGAAAESLVAYCVQQREEVPKKLDQVRQVIDRTRPKFEEIQGNHRAGRYSDAERNLMIEGLLKGFLEQVDAPPA